jgi:hypothetical protein
LLLRSVSGTRWSFNPPQGWSHWKSLQRSLAHRLLASYSPGATPFTVPCCFYGVSPSQDGVLMLLVASLDAVVRERSCLSNLYPEECAIITNLFTRCSSIQEALLFQGGISASMESTSRNSPRILRLQTSLNDRPMRKSARDCH